MSDTSLENLFLRWRELRDAGALASVFDQAAPALLRLARHLAPVGVEAEDLLQTTFLVALEAPGEWDAERPLVPWLAGILGRRALSERRRSARTPEVDRLRTPPVDDPVTATLDGETAELLNSALARVPERYREILEGRLVKGRAASELAHELGRSPSTVHVQMHRGLRFLRRVLPASLAPGAAGATGASRELAVVRRMVLRAARRRAGVLALGRSGVVPLLAGFAAVLLVVVGAWFMTREGANRDASLTRADRARIAPTASAEGALVEPRDAPERAAAGTLGAVTSSQEPEPRQAREEEDEADDGESGVIRWWVVGRVIAPPNVDHGPRAWQGTKVRIRGRGVGMEFGVVREDGNFRQPMLSPPPWESVQEDVGPGESRTLTFEVSHPEFLPGRQVIALDERIGDTYSVELELFPAGRVRGAATDGTGADLPVCFTQVYPLVDEQLGVPAILDRGFGRPSSYDMLAAPGEAVVAVAIGGLRPGAARALVLEGTAQELPTIVLEKGATLEGRVQGPSDPDTPVEARLDATGVSRTLGPLEVTWYRGGLEWSLVRASVDPEGNFQFAGLVPGARYRITCGEREGTGVAGAGRIEL